MNCPGRPLSFLSSAGGGAGHLRPGRPLPASAFAKPIYRLPAQATSSIYTARRRGEAKEVTAASSVRQP